MTLVEFLQARLDEDEGREGVWERIDRVLRLSDFRAYYARRRRLAEVEAKRRIVDEHRGLLCENMRHPNGEHCAVCSYDDAKREWVPCPTLRYLAGVYADHPDYDEAWRP